MVKPAKMLKNLGDKHTDVHKTSINFLYVWNFSKWHAIKNIMGICQKNIAAKWKVLPLAKAVTI